MREDSIKSISYAPTSHTSHTSHRKHSVGGKLGAEGPEGERSGSPHADGSAHEILSAEAACAHLGISEAHLRKLLSGQLDGPPLKHARAGRRILIRRAWLEEWIEASAAHAAREAEARKASEAEATSPTTRRRRIQRGSLVRRQHGNHENWLGFWYDADGRRRCQVLGRAARMTEGQARAALDRIIAPLNAGRTATAPALFAEYVERVFIPLQAQYWKDSTARTSEQRIRRHLVGAFGKRDLASIGRADLQAFLDSKTGEHAASTIKHLRGDLNEIFKLALSDHLVQTNPAALLRVAARMCKPARKPRALSPEDVRALLAKLAPRERLICRFGIFEGLRVGEIYGLRWGDVSGRALSVARRVYQGQLNTPKSGQTRICALSDGTAALLCELKTAADWTEPEDFIFASQNRKSPLRPENVWKNAIQPALPELGLEWLTYHQLRHTNGTLIHKAGVDPKVSADQRGHQIGVSLAVYTHSDLEQKRAALCQLEELIKENPE